MEALGIADLPVGQPLQLQLKGRPSHAIETVGLIDGARSFSVRKGPQALAASEA